MKRIGIGPISNDNPSYTYLLTIAQKNYLRKFFYVPTNNSSSLVPSRSHPFTFTIQKLKYFDLLGRKEPTK
jgi:hypothetical protein